MKKFMLGIVAVSLVSVAAMGAAFDIAPGAVEPVALDPGQSVWVDITVNGQVPGMDLFLGVEGPFTLTGILVDEVGAGTVFVGRSSGATTGLGEGGTTAYSLVTTNTGTVGPGVVAKIQITANGPIGATGFVTTNSPLMGVPSDFADGLDAVQDSLNLKIVPEPMTALMLLAVVPFLRRRHA